MVFCADEVRRGRFFAAKRGGWEVSTTHDAWTGRVALLEVSLVPQMSQDKLTNQIQSNQAEKGTDKPTTFLLSFFCRKGCFFDEAVQRVSDGEKVILVRNETSPDDIHGLHAAEGAETCQMLTV